MVQKKTGNSKLYHHLEVNYKIVSKFMWFVTLYSVTKRQNSYFDFLIDIKIPYLVTIKPNKTLSSSTSLKNKININHQMNEWVTLS